MHFHFSRESFQCDVIGKSVLTNLNSVLYIMHYIFPFSSDYFSCYVTIIQQAHRMRSDVFFK